MKVFIHLMKFFIQLVRKSLKGLFSQPLISPVSQWDSRPRLASPYCRLYLPWIGGAVVASQPTMISRWIVDEEYRELGPGIAQLSPGPHGLSFMQLALTSPLRGMGG